MLFYLKNDCILSFWGVIMNNIAFENTFSSYKFANDKSEPISSRKLFNHQFRFVKSGRFVVKCEAKTLVANAGDIIYIPSEREWEGHGYAEPYLSGSVIQLCLWPNVDILDYPPQVFKATDDIIELFETVAGYGTELTTRYLWQLYFLLEKIEVILQKNSDKRLFKLRKAVEYMQEHDTYTIKELAKLCQMSESRFFIAFKECVGITPIQMKHRIQATKAEKLLIDTNLSIEEIAQKVGFNSTAHFRKVFYSRYGCSPKEIRKKLNK